MDAFFELDRSTQAAIVAFICMVAAAIFRTYYSGRK